jgi:hypothetical protein
MAYVNRHPYGHKAGTDFATRRFSPLRVLWAFVLRAWIAPPGNHIHNHQITRNKNPNRRFKASQRVLSLESLRETNSNVCRAPHLETRAGKTRLGGIHGCW